MKICQLDKELNEIVSNHHVYGAECIINSLVRACIDENYLDFDDLCRMLRHSYEHERRLK